MNVADYYKAVHISHMRQIMRYDLAAYKEDWALSIALAELMAASGKEHLEPMLDSCIQRIHAFAANNPDVIPFDYRPGAEGAYDDLVKLCEEYKQ